MIVAGTGHRPNKLGGYSIEARDKLTLIAHTYLKTNNAVSVISGMALGWDTALAIAALQLKIPLICSIPFKGQEKMWTPKAKHLYFAILAKAETINYVCEPGFAAYKMQLRNEAMVDGCDILLAMHDGTTGGTDNCIKYAKKQNTKIINLYDKYEQ